MIPARRFEPVSLIRGAVVVASGNGVGLVLAFAMNLVLARSLGPGGTGLFMLSVAVCMVVATLSRLGLDPAIIRFLAGHIEMAEWSALRSRILSVLMLAAGGSLAGALALFTFAPPLSEIVFGKPELSAVLRGMSGAVLAMSMTVVYAQFCKAVRRPGWGTLIQNVSNRALMLALLVVLFPLDLTNAVVAYVASLSITAVIAALVWNRCSPDLAHAPAALDFGPLLENAAALMPASAFRLTIAWAPLLFVGAWASTADTGLFAVANRTAAVLGMITMSVNTVVAPAIAGCHRRGAVSELQGNAKRASWLVMVVTAPLCIGVIVYATPLLSIFGPGFAAGGVLLSIMVAGHFANGLAASATQVLLMCDHTRVYRNVVALGALGTLIAHAALVPTLGVLGAAVATALTTPLQNLLAAAWLRWNLGIDVLPRRRSSPT